MSEALSEEVHSKLVANGLLALGDCPNPRELSDVVNQVWAKTTSQKDFVLAMGPSRFKNASPNEGYVSAAALMLEGIVRTIVTLNFDLALSHSVARLNPGERIAILKQPEEWAQSHARTIVYLHRNMECLPDDLVLRPEQLTEAWRHGWEGVVAAAAVSGPISVFVGLGTPTPVLTATTERVRNALIDSEVFLVGPGDRESSDFAASLKVDDDHYVQLGWNEFMRELTTRTVLEHRSQALAAAAAAAADNGVELTDISATFDRIGSAGIEALGMARGRWVWQRHEYIPLAATAETAFVAQLLEGVARIESQTGSTVSLEADGILEFRIGRRVLGRATVASGRGTRTSEAVQTKVKQAISEELLGFPIPPSVLVVAATTAPPEAVIAPADITRDEVANDIVTPNGGLTVFTVEELAVSSARLTALWAAA